MENDGFLDALAEAFRKTQCVSAPKEAFGAFTRFKYDYEEACKQQNAQFSDQIASLQWEKLESDSKQEYARLSKRDSELYSKLLSKYNHINSLGKKKSDGSVLFFQEKGSKSNQNLQQQWDMLLQEEKRIYEVKAKQNQQDTIKSLIEDYILEYKNYENNLKEKPENIKFINKQEEENDEIDQIDIIIGIKRINGKKEYLVRFKGKTGKDAKWFPKKRLRKVKDLVKEFEDAYFRQSFQDEEPSSGFDSTPALPQEKIRQEIDLNEIEQEQEGIQVEPLDQPIQTQPHQNKIKNKKKMGTEKSNETKKAKSMAVTKKIKKTIQNLKPQKEIKQQEKNKSKQNSIEIKQSTTNNNKSQKCKITEQNNLQICSQDQKQKQLTINQQFVQKQSKKAQKQQIKNNTRSKSTQETKKEENKNKLAITPVLQKRSISAKPKQNNDESKLQNISTTKPILNSKLIKQTNKLDQKKYSQLQKKVSKIQVHTNIQNKKSQKVSTIKLNNKNTKRQLNKKKDKQTSQQVQVKPKNTIDKAVKTKEQTKPTPQIIKKQIRKQVVTRQSKKKINDIKKPLPQASKKPTQSKKNTIQERRKTQRKIKKKI